VLPHEVEAEQGIEITAKELKSKIDADGKDLIVIDVREPHEWDISHLDFARLIPKGDLPDHLKEFDATKDYVLHCKSGVRSLEAARLMKAAGFRVKSLRGGINAWAREIDPRLPTY
jgi:rhodanese-related sulfurtransferase